MSWLLGGAALVVLTLGLVSYRRSRRGDDGQTAAILSFIVGADLLVFAVAATLA